MLQFWLVSQKCHLRISSCVVEAAQQNVQNAISGGYCGGAPPLPIPNREVKPAYADGTAMQCGRVGSRLFSIQGPVTEMSWDSFFLVDEQIARLAITTMITFLLSPFCFLLSYFSFLLSPFSFLFLAEHGLHGLNADDVYRKKQERTTYRRMLCEQCDMCRYPSVNKFPMSIRTHHV